LDELTVIIRESFDIALPAGGGDVNTNYRMLGSDPGTGTFSVYNSTNSAVLRTLG